MKEASRAFHKAFSSAQELCEARKPVMVQQLANQAMELTGQVQVGPKLPRFYSLAAAL